MRILILAAMLLAGCKPAEPAPEAPAAEKPAAEAAAQKPPSAAIVSEASLPAAPDSQVTVNGWGPVRIGMTLEELNAAVGEKLDPKEDAGFEEYQCTFLFPKTAPEGLSLMYSHGQVARIDVDKPGVATYGGVQVGDTASKAREVFGAALNAQPHFYTGLPAEYLTVWTVGGPQPDWNGPPSAEEIAALNAARGVRFETSEKGVIERFYAGSGAIEMVEGCL